MSFRSHPSLWPKSCWDVVQYYFFQLEVPCNTKALRCIFHPVRIKTALQTAYPGQNSFTDGLKWWDFHCLLWLSGLPLGRHQGWAICHLTSAIRTLVIYPMLLVQPRERGKVSTSNGQLPLLPLVWERLDNLLKPCMVQHRIWNPAPYFFLFTVYKERIK